MRVTHRWTTRVAVGTLVAVLLASAGFAQGRWNGSRRRMPPRYRPADHRDNGFSFCRLKYTSVRREPAGRGWRTDYPAADVNFMIRLSELTSTQVDFGDEGNPNHWVVEITDPELFSCPFVLTSDVGTMGLNDEEVERLHTYLVKGGFLWVDDFWGTAAWNQWSDQIGRVLPPGEYPIIDLSLDHPLFRTLYPILKVPQIANIRFWRNTGGSSTAERGVDSAEAHFRAIRDKNGRIMVAMTYNTDIQDAWEREGEDPRFFERFAPDGYALGVNVLLYAMTH